MGFIKFPLIVRPILTVALLGVVGEGVTIAYEIGKFYIELHYIAAIKARIRTELMEENTKEMIKRICKEHPELSRCEVGVKR